MIKKISLAILFVLQLSFVVRGQTIDPGSEWRVNYSRVEVGSEWYLYQNFYKDFIDGDTLLNSHEYHKIYRSGYTYEEWIGWPGWYSYYEHQFHGYLREENDKWYIYYQNQDKLLYNFTLETGATFESILLGYCSPPVIDNVDSIIIDGEYKKRFHLIYEGGSMGAEYVIEGIGATTGLFEAICQFEFASDLVCYARDGISLWGASTEACNLAVGINENEGKASICRVFPNPAKDFTLLTIPDGFDKVSFTLMDLFGRIVCKESFGSPSNNKIHLTSYQPGIYLVVMESNGLRQTAKLIIE